MDLKAYFNHGLDEHLKVAAETREATADAFSNLMEMAVNSIRSGGKIMFFGNGGSAADAQHLATELSIQYMKARAPIAAIALTTDTSALTAAANDLGYDQVFARQLQAVGKSGDIAIGFSTSGRSPNVLNALGLARDMGVGTVGFTGHSGGDMDGVCDVLLKVPAESTARIQEMHILLGHMLCGALEIELGLTEQK